MTTYTPKGDVLTRGKLYKISTLKHSKEKYEFVAYGLFLKSFRMAEGLINIYQFLIGDEEEEFWGTSPYLFEEVAKLDEYNE